ncbi:MAG: cysteine desulfurase [Candidatus Nealsonbacteria bacterium DGGOD1a]|jgi:Cysteine sulfinate desulfinase/cysteine desulfurase and related enzymes|nr:MAG: cysteine desulfurase [Candidatus Nealsonbacteria bacterium DGGOD1a]
MMVKKIIVKKNKSDRQLQPKRIYMDYGAATPVDPRAAKLAAGILPEIFANSMSFHSFGQDARAVLEQSRQDVASVIGAPAKEIIFTGSATESNNLALKGVMFANRQKGKHLIISPIEHACVMESAAWLEKQGFEVTRLKVDKYGLANPDDVAAAIRSDTVLVSVMHANNEIGTIEPIAEIGKICRDKGAYFHTDAAQSFGKIEIDVSKMNIDLLTASSQKIYGPKGAACLFVRQGVKIEPILHGGGQESGMRSSTVNVPAIYGFAQAALIAKKEMAKESARQIKLRDKLIAGILKNIPRSHLNGHPAKRLPGNANIWFEFVEGESMIIQMDINGIAASTGSACSSAKLTASHVLTAIGLKPQEAHGSLRLSIGRQTKDSDVNYVLKTLPKIITRLREISPFKAND